MICKGYMNLYHNGFYHRRGKPHDVNIHGGDLYLTEEAAKSQIEPAAGYIATVPVQFENNVPLQANPEDSTPVPLHRTRSMIQTSNADWLDRWPFATKAEESLYGAEMPTSQMIAAMDETLDAKRDMYAS